MELNELLGQIDVNLEYIREHRPLTSAEIRELDTY